MAEAPQLATRVHEDYASLDAPHSFQQMPVHVQTLVSSPNPAPTLPRAAEKRSPIFARSQGAMREERRAVDKNLVGFGEVDRYAQALAAARARHNNEIV